MIEKRGYNGTDQGATKQVHFKSQGYLAEHECSKWGDFRSSEIRTNPPVRYTQILMHQMKQKLNQGLLYFKVDKRRRTI